MQIRRPHPQHPPRGGFTLIELMIVIAIIGILLAFLLPALSRIWTSTRDAQVKVEIKSLEQAIAGFKVAYGIEPPSGIYLSESAAGWIPTAMDSAGLRQAKLQSQALLRRIWPRFDFTLARHFNDNGNQTDVIYLNGAECLVFFLGGMRVTTNMVGSPAVTPGFSPTDPVAMIGFSKNPANPFAYLSSAGETRNGPFMEFKPAQLTRSTRQNSASTNHTFVVYNDAFPGHTDDSAPYLYFSSYEGRGYRPTGVDGVAGTADDEALPNFTTKSPPWSGVYLSSSSGAVTVPYNQKSYQIISAGADHDFGVGGLFTEASGSNPTYTGNSADNDNITNFHGGRLKP